MIGRARIVFFAGLIAAIVIVATEFPLGQLMRARAALAQGSSQLRALDTENRQLAGQIRSLHRDSTVARIAHEDYGLVKKGQRSIVVLPSPSTSPGDGSGPLSTTTVPTSDLVPTDAIVSGTASGAKSMKQPGFWSRLVQRLEFWRATP
jgi:cell division protein FtsB